MLFRRVCSSVDFKCDGGCVLCTAADLFRFLNSVGFVNRCQSYNSVHGDCEGGSMIRVTVRFVRRGLDGAVHLTSVTTRMGLSISCFSGLFRRGANSSPLQCLACLEVRRTYRCLSFAGLGVGRVDPLMNCRSSLCFSQLFAGAVKIPPSTCGRGGGNWSLHPLPAINPREDGQRTILSMRVAVQVVHPTVAYDGESEGFEEGGCGFPVLSRHLYQVGRAIQPYGNGTFWDYAFGLGSVLLLSRVRFRFVPFSSVVPRCEDQAKGVFSVAASRNGRNRATSRLLLVLEVGIVDRAGVGNRDRAGLIGFWYFDLYFARDHPFKVQLCFLKFRGVDRLCGVGKRVASPLPTPVHGRDEGRVFVLFQAACVDFALVPCCSFGKGDDP